MECDRSKALVHVYLDGELSEELAAPLRRHLMECAACRGAVAEAKAMSSWFVPGPELAVPAGFAARVTERATQGIRSDWRLVGGGGGAAPERGVLVPHRTTGAPERATVAPDRATRFAMSFAAAAAAVLLGLTVLLASDERQGLDGRGGLQATDPLEHTLERLEELNARDAAGAVTTDAQKVEDAAADAATRAPNAR